MSLFNERAVYFWSLGTLAYRQAYRIQELLVERHSEFQLSKGVKYQGNTLLLVEHQPVYTIGIRTAGYTESEERRLKALGAEFYLTNRGGLITFHGTGQLVAYPILHLGSFTKSMRWYICKLEETVIQMCKCFGIDARRSSDTGVWVENDKICAMGVHGSRYITTHGLALNCNIDLKWFANIIPCGIYGKGVTSLSAVLKKNTGIQEAVGPFMGSFCHQFDCQLEPLPTTVKEKLIQQLISEEVVDSKLAKRLITESPWL